MWRRLAIGTVCSSSRNGRGVPIAISAGDRAAQRFIQRLSLRKSGPKVRLVLLTRRIPDWWRKLPAKSEFIDDLLTPEISPEPLRLSPLFSPGPTRESALSRAVQVVAEVLDREPPAGQIETDLAKPIFDNKEGVRRRFPAAEQAPGIIPKT